MAQRLLEVDDLSVHFATEDGMVRAVDGVSVTLDRGEVVGVVGESGSGKSVTAMTIMGLTRGVNAKFDGAVRYQGTDLLQISDTAMQNYRGNEIGMIFQDPMTSLNPVYRVGEQITEAIRAHEQIDKRQARKRAVELLKQVGIPNPESRVDDFPHQFSGGMRQRAMIAMALSCNPAILIADEPTTALDVTIQAQIIELIGRLKRDFDSSVRRGTAAISACVYGWPGSANTCSVEPYSTGAPAYITRISSATSATTPRSCVIRITAESKSSLSLSINSRICAWIVTSSAVVGSSAISTSGLWTSAIAIIAR
jgi:ABC-type dipeptide/oligopeptide/nickel transport system ATPase subunit